MNATDGDRRRMQLAGSKEVVMLLLKKCFMQMKK